MTDSSSVADAFDSRPGVSSLDGAIVFGVAKAGACYAAFWLFGSILFDILIIGLRNSELVMLRVLFAAFAIGFGALCGLFFGCLALLFTAAFYASIQREMDFVYRGSIIGGLAGYFAMATIAIAQNPAFQWRPFLVRFLFTVTAAVLGMIGAALGAHKFLLEHNPPKSGIATESRFRFGVREIFVVIAWCCGVLGTMKLIGLLAGPTALITVVIGIVIQPAIYFSLTQIPWLRNKLAHRPWIE